MSKRTLLFSLTLIGLIIIGLVVYLSWYRIQNELTVFKALRGNTSSPIDIEMICDLERQEFQKTQTRMKVAYSWETDKGRIYAPIIGRVPYLPTGMTEFSLDPTKKFAEQNNLTIIGECEYFENSRNFEYGIATGPSHTTFYNAKGDLITDCYSKGGDFDHMNPSICEFFETLHPIDAEIIIGTGAHNYK